MRFGGKQLTTTNTETVKLKRGEDTITLTVCPLPMGWTSRTLGRLDMRHPSPPKKAVKLSNGQVVRDIGSIKYEEDTDDPKYRAEVDKLVRLTKGMQLRDHLRLDKTVTFDSVAPDNDEDHQGWRDYADKLAGEIEDSGLTDEEMNLILAEGEGIQVIMDTEGAKDEFLGE